MREAIASKIIAYYWIQTGYNISDMLSKHWDHPSVYNIIMELLITRGPIRLIPEKLLKINHLNYQCPILHDDKQLQFLQGGSNMIFPKAPILLVLLLHELLSTLHDTHQCNILYIYLSS